MTLDPVAEQTNFSDNSFPLKRREHVDSHGPGGRLPPSGCKASGKTRVIDPGPNCGTSYAFLITVSRCYLKNAEGEGSLSLAAFLRFHLARGDVWFVFLCIVRKQDCLIDQSPSQTGVQRRASSGAGVRGPQRPLPPFAPQPQNRNCTSSI